MENSTRSGLFIATFLFVIFCAGGHLLQTSTDAGTDLWTKSNAQEPSKTLDCDPVEYAVEDVVLLNDNLLYVKTEKKTVQFVEYQTEGNRMQICPSHRHIRSEEFPIDCTNKLSFESHEFEILPNKSALIAGIIFTPDEFNLKGKELIICVPDGFIENGISPSGMTFFKVIGYISIVGSSISVIALIIHLIIFCSVPGLRNLPGCNLASLSIAFLLGFSSGLIGQIPGAVGTYCMVIGVLQQNFMLTAFFCMNVLSFDVWRALRLSTKKLRLASEVNGKKRFIWYSLYSWGCPFIISTISVVLDNTDSFPDNLKPHYDMCWLVSNTGRIIFYGAPAFNLVTVNGIFFLLSRRMISNNTMKGNNDQENEIDRINYLLHMRLGVMMGLSWLLSFVASLFTSWILLWFIALILNSLQGLLLLLFFTCTKKVFKKIKGRTQAR